jgi:hypothetical protein
MHIIIRTLFFFFFFWLQQSFSFSCLFLHHHSELKRSKALEVDHGYTHLWQAEQKATKESGDIQGWLVLVILHSTLIDSAQG